MAKFYLDKIPDAPSVSAAAPQAVNVPGYKPLRAGGSPPRFGTVDTQVQPRDISSALSLEQKPLPEQLSRSLIGGTLAVGEAYGRAAQDVSNTAFQLGNTFAELANQLGKSKDVGDSARAQNLWLDAEARFNLYAEENNLNAVQRKQEWAMREMELRGALLDLPMSPQVQEEVYSKFQLFSHRKNTELTKFANNEQRENDTQANIDLIDTAVNRGDKITALEANDNMLAAQLQNPAQHAKRKQDILQGVAEFEATRDLMINPEIVKGEMEEKIRGTNINDLYPDMTDISVIRKFQDEANRAIAKREADAVNEISDGIASGTIKSNADINNVNKGRASAATVKKLEKVLADPDPAYDQNSVVAAGVAVDTYVQERLDSGLPEYHRIQEVINSTVPKDMQGPLRSKLYERLTKKPDAEKLPGQDPVQHYLGQIWSDHNDGFYLPKDAKSKKGTKKINDLDVTDPKQREWRDQAVKRASLIYQSLREWAAANPQDAKDPSKVEAQLQELNDTDVSQLGKAKADPKLSGAPAALHSNTSIAAYRASVMAEIENDPKTKKLVMQMLDTEGGGAATLEALVNRTLMIREKVPGHTIWDELNSGFYGPINRGHAQTLKLHADTIASYQREIDRVKAGSNVIQGRTDQGYVGDPNWRGPGRVQVEGVDKNEVYNFWVGKRGKAQFTHADSARFAARFGRAS